MHEMTLGDELGYLEADRRGTVTWATLRAAMGRLVARYGTSATGPWMVVGRDGNELCRRGTAVGAVRATMSGPWSVSAAEVLPVREYDRAKREALRHIHEMLWSAPDARRGMAPAERRRQKKLAKLQAQAQEDITDGTDGV